MADRLSLLRTFVAMVDEGSLIAAARALRRSPPAVSRALAELEALTGVSLVERTTRRFKATEAGRRLADQARLLLVGYDEAIAEASGATLACRGLVRVTAPLVFGREHVAPLLSTFLDAWPGIVVDLQLADRVVDLHDENFDLGVRIGAVADQSLISFRLGSVREVTVAAPAYLAERGTPETPLDVATHEAIQHTSLGASEPWWFRSMDGRPQRINVNARFAINQADAAIAAARAGRGLVRVLSYQVADDLRHGTLVRVLQDYEPEPKPVTLVWPDSRRALGRVKLLVHHLKSLKALAVLQQETSPSTSPAVRGRRGKAPA
jgi:DNA-binding transcriptional LysR family regulator